MARTAHSQGGRMCRVIVTCAVMMGLLGCGLMLSAPAGAISPHYERLAAEKLAGLPVGCPDITYAASHKLIEPVEVHWLFDLGVCNVGRIYEVMLAIRAQGTLSCADIRWNAAYGQLDYVQAPNLLAYVSGCSLSIYELLVTQLSGPPASGSSGRSAGVLTCVDVTWHLDQGLITIEQAGWLRDALVAEGVPCVVRGSVSVVSFNARLAGDAALSHSVLRLLDAFIGPLEGVSTAINITANQASTVITGLRDDSTAALKYDLQLTSAADGGFRLLSATVSRSCHLGRGHIDFSFEPCT